MLHLSSPVSSCLLLRIASTSIANAAGGGGGLGVEFGEDVIARPEDALGIASSLYGMDHKNMEKFLQQYYGGLFPAIFLSSSPQLLEDGELGLRGGGLLTLLRTRMYAEYL